MKANIKKGIQAVIAAQGGSDLQARIGQQVRARLDGAKAAGFALVQPSAHKPQSPSL